MKISELKIIKTKIKNSVHASTARMTDERGKNQWTWRQNNRNYPVLTIEIKQAKKIKRTEPQGPVGQY